MRDEIVASWERCARAGLRPDRFEVPYDADVDDRGRLCWAGGPVLDQVGGDLDGTGVVPFHQGVPSTSKTVGQIPADYTQGSGTLASGTTANKATEAALAAYPGGIVDRVVELSNGEYEVHYIGVNWPHHIFVNQDFKVIGAND